MADISIHGLVGFGFPGKTGDPGEIGYSTTFSEIKYKTEYEIINPFKEEGENKTYRYEFVSDKTKYVEVSQQHLYENDQIIVCGNGKPTLYNVIKDGNSYLIDDREHINTFSSTFIPEYQFNIYHVLTQADPQIATYGIRLYHTFTSDYDKDFNLFYSVCDDYNIETEMSMIIKDFDTVITESTDINGVYLSGGDKKYIHIFAYYRLNHYKYKKIYLKSLEISTG